MERESIKPIFEKLPENYWYEVAANLYKESGEIPDLLQIRAAAILRALGLPLGESSSLSFHEGQERTDEEVEKDKIIAELLTNKPGVIVDKQSGIVSTDFRDLYPEGLPEELKYALDPSARAIMEIEYEHAKSVKEKNRDAQDQSKMDLPVRYCRLPGGVDLFLRGYAHLKRWHENHKKFFQGINKNAKIISIEGGSLNPLGDSMELYWSNPQKQWGGHYDALMHEAVESGFNGLFSEIDARDSSKVVMDHDEVFSYPNLPDAFYQKNFAFLQKEHPRLAEIIQSPKGLKQCLTNQSTTKTGAQSSDTFIEQQGKLYCVHEYLPTKGVRTLDPTFLELGQRFSLTRLPL